MKNRFNEVSISIVLAWAVFALPSSSRADYSVLWDTSHGVFSSDYHPITGEYYEDLTDHLAANDFTVSATDSSGFTSTSLLGVDVAVICASSSVTGSDPYTSQEVTDLANFVSTGGGLLIMSDSIAIPNTNMQPVATEFDIELGASGLSSDGLYFNALEGDFSTHPVFDGIDSIYFYNGSALRVDGDAEAIAWEDNTDPDTIAIAANESYGFGRVIVLGDSTLWTNINPENAFDTPYNREFALNTFTHLAVPEPATIILVGAGAVAVARRRRSK